jgi:peptidyl-prolyl cis-trans isomerase D
MAEPKKLTLKVVVTRIVVSVMFGMLILSFAIWGIGDIFRNVGGLKSVAEVGSVRITPQQFQEAYRRELRRLQNTVGEPIEPARARELHVPQRVLQEMVARVLFELAARDAGVAVDDGVVRQAILDNQAFHDAQGKFDRDRFEQLVNNAGYSEDGFIDLMRHDLARAQVTDAVIAGAAMPPEEVAAIYKYRNERRVAEMLTVTAASVKNVAQPSEADLEAYHKDHAEIFTAPEYRAVTAVHLTPSEVAPRITISDDKVKEEYDTRAGEFQIPEHRAVRQILASDEAQAKAVEALLLKGTGFEDAAKSATGEPPADLGMLQQSDLVGSPEAAKAIFALKPGEATAPIHDELGWHIFQVSKIELPRSRSLAEMHDQIVHDLQLHEAGDQVYSLGNRLQDLLGGGATLEEAAQKLDLKLIKVAAMDGEGNGADGKPIADLPQSPKFIQTVFSSQAGQASELIDDGANGYLVIRVDKITPSAVRPLAEIHDQVVKDWQDEERHRQAAKLATSLLDRAKGGTPLGTLAQEGGYPYSTMKPVNRTGEGPGVTLPPELVAALFAAKPGEVVKSPSADGTIIAKLSEILPADPKSDPAGLAKLDEQLRSAQDTDLLDAYEEALSRRYGVEVNNGVLDSLIGS